MQATLWDAVETDQPVPPIGGTLEHPSRWADGDACPESLARLAALLLKPGTNIHTMRTTDGHVIWFRIVAAHIEGDHVALTLKRIEPLVRGAMSHDDDSE